MTGWWLSAFLLLGKSALTIRLPAIIGSLAIALLIRRGLREVDAEKAAIVGGLFLWSPHNVLNVIMTTDTPLVFLSVVSGLFAIRACRSDHASDYLLSGLFLGLAFLAKYFAVVLGFAYAVLFLFFCDNPRIRGLALVVLAVLPSAAVNIVWNFHHGWVNILFNFYTRQEQSGFSLLTTLVFLGVTLALMGPIAWFLLRKTVDGRVPWSRAWRKLEEAGLKPWAIIFLVPHVVFLVVSTFHGVGVHWVLSFYPFLFGAIVGLFSLPALQGMIRPMQFFSGSLAALLVIVLLLPVTVAKNHKSYPTIIVSTHPEKVLAAIEQLGGDYLLATPSYTRSALLNFYHDRYVPVLGSNSYHGRQDDLISDVSEFDGRDIVMVVKNREIEKVSAMFESVEVRELDVMGAKLPVVLGHNFQYASYRKNSLQWVADTYYQIPSWLASWSPRSSFLEKYNLEHSPPGEELPDPRDR
jgi:4-amino-4-deoxy-L-arabinose transferase-like glycosyltransferase